MLGLIRRWLELPPARCRAAASPVRMTMRDGTRLAGLHLRPVGLAGVPTLLVRTPYGTAGRLAPWRWLGRLLCEAGHHVVLQDVRGRGDSEGRFAPFHHEARDGGDTLEWIAARDWCEGRVVTLGASYEAYAGWAALGERPELVSGLVAIEGTRDLYRSFWGSGAFGLYTSLDWISGVGEREPVPAGTIDLERGLRHRPVREADRVALRRLDTFREWIDHPRRDAYWDALLPPLPDEPRPVLSIAGWTDVFTDAQLADWEALTARGAAPGSRLVVGPWRHGTVSNREWRRERLARVAFRELLAFLERLPAPASAGQSRPQPAAVRYYAHRLGAWREEPAWPPPAEPTALYLGPHGGAGFEPPAVDEAASRFESDPEQPCPSTGGPLIGRPGGLRAPVELEGRGDLLRFEGPPLEAPLDLAGRARVVLHLEGDAPDLDVSVRLFDVSPGGRALAMVEGYQRLRWRGLRDDEEGPRLLEMPSEGPWSEEVALDTWPIAWRLARGHRLLVVVAAASFPRFDRNPQSAAPPGRAEIEEHRRAGVTVRHDAGHPSRVELPRVQW